MLKPRSEGQGGVSRPRYRLRSKLLLLCGALLFGVLLMEIGLRLFYPSDRIEHTADDELLWTLTPNQVGYVDLGGSWRRSPVTVIDTRGFRVSGTVDPGVARDRVLALGDSYTFGWGVGDRETFCAQLQEMSHGKLEVINAGIPGYGLFQEEGLLRRVIDDIRPRYIVVTVIEGDVLRQPFDSEAEKKAFLRSARLRERIRSLSRFVTVMGRTLERLSLASTGRAVPNARVNEGSRETASSSTFRSCWEADRLRLLAMRDLAASRGARLILVAWPQSTNNTSFFLAEMRNLAREQGIPLVDIAVSLERHSGEALKISGDGHPSPVAHAIAAEEILRVLASSEPESRARTEQKELGK